MDKSHSQIVSVEKMKPSVWIHSMAYSNIPIRQPISDMDAVHEYTIYLSITNTNLAAKRAFVCYKPFYWYVP